MREKILQSRTAGLAARARGVLVSSTARSALSFTSSGLSFAAANLLFAHALPVESYATLALCVAIVMLGSSVGMLGADGIVNRHSVAPDARLFWRVASTAAVTALLAAFLVSLVYEIPATTAWLLVPAVAGFSITRFCGAWLQARLQFAASLLLFNSINYLLLAVALVSQFFVPADPATPLMQIAVLQCAVAAGAVLLVRTHGKGLTSSYVYSWRESLAFLFMATSGEVLVQLERLVTPQALELEDLATLGVLLAIVGPPFRLLYLALGYDLLPKLRQAAQQAERSALILRHSLLALLVIVPIWIVVWFGVPALQRSFLGVEYALSRDLLLAALIGGTIKGFSGIARAGVTALASVRGMEVMGLIGWGSIAVAVAAAGFGAEFGLTGIVYAVSLGWFVRLAASLVLVLRSLDAGETTALAATARPAVEKT